MPSNGQQTKITIITITISEKQITYGGEQKIKIEKDKMI
jgi:hypothetical protein